MKIGVFVGSLRKESFNRRVANVLLSIAPESLDLELIEIGHLSFYNQDLDTDSPPPDWVEFRQKIKSLDGVIFVTPEYNRSVPGVLKNAIDVASRPYGDNAWAGKAGGVISVSPGAIGGFGANQHLRQSLVFVDVPVLQQPEMYLGSASKFIDDQGKITNEKTMKLLQDFLDAYVDWVTKIRGVANEAVEAPNVFGKKRAAPEQRTFS